MACLLLVLLLWCIVSVPVALVVGQICAGADRD